MNKILCTVCWALWFSTVIMMARVNNENKELRAALNEPVNCEAVCEVMFEEMGC